jgi:hypothetical protein
VKYLLLAIGLLLQEHPSEDPHAGQPESCNNYHDTAEAHKCKCGRAMMCNRDPNAPEDSKCQTYCRKEACKCIGPCDTHKHGKKGPCAA